MKAKTRELIRALARRRQVFGRGARAIGGLKKARREHGPEVRRMLRYKYLRSYGHRP